MKLQSSIEFIIILAAISSLIVFALSIYFKFYSSENQVFNSIIEGNMPKITNPTSSNLSGQSNFNFNVYITNSSYGEYKGIIELKSDEFSRFRINYISTDNGKAYSNVTTGNLSGIKLVKFYYYPKNYMNSTIGFSISDTYNSKTATLNKSIRITIDKPNFTDPDLKLNLVSNISNNDRLYKFHMMVKCSAMNGDTELPLDDQCGRNASYDFFMFSNYCFYEKDIMTKTFCVYKDNSNSIIMQSGANPRLEGNFTIDYEGKKIISNITSLDSYLYSDNEIIGDLLIPNIKYKFNYPLIFKDGNFYKIPEDPYISFVSQSNYLDNMLLFFNNKSIGVGEYEILNESLNSYDLDFIKLSEYGSIYNDCYIEGGAFKCPIEPSEAIAVIYGNKYDQTIVHNQTVIEIR